MDERDPRQQTLALQGTAPVAPRASSWRACLIGLWRDELVSEGTLRALASETTERALDPRTSVWHRLCARLQRRQRERLEALVAERDVSALERRGREIEQELARAEVTTVVLGDEAYPAQLASSGLGPAVLSVAGSTRVLCERLLAVVGTRHPTSHALALCRRLVEEVAGVSPTRVIASGGALGIDGCAHRVALDQGAPTVVVSATGIDIAYPTRHRDIFRRAVSQGGAVVSQFPPGTPPRPERFPRRNPTLAGLCEATVVVEAPARSGALQTAAAARRVGRPVWVIPSLPFTDRTRGGHGLIQGGEAGLLDSPTQLSQLERGSQSRPSAVGVRSSGSDGTGRRVRREGSASSAPSRSSPDVASWPSWTRRAVAALSSGEISRDALLSALGDSPHGRLLELELGGLVRRVAGDRFRLVEGVGRVEDLEKS